MDAFNRLRLKARLQNGGILSFLLGTTGVGKTTAVYSAATHLNDSFATVLLVPSEEPLRNLPIWLDANLPAASAKTTPVLFDGREITDDIVGLKQFLAWLNQVLRRRPDLLFFWPTTDNDWYLQLKQVADSIGGTNLTPLDADIEIEGPAREDWPKILERLLIQLDLSFQDIAIDAAVIDALAAEDSTPNIGRFLEKIGQLIIDRVPMRSMELGLPPLRLIISSGHEGAGEANRIRRANTLALKAEELLGYSPRSKAGKWWKARLQTPEHHLAYIISLFDARLLTMTASSVAYAMLSHGNDDLQTAVQSEGMRAHKGNAKRTLEATDTFKFFRGESISELTSTRKGVPADSTIRAYKAIQARSAKQHKAINTALVALLDEHIDELAGAQAQFEVDGGSQNLYTDSIVPIADTPYFLEFHHLSPEHCSASKMAAYIMEKLQAYALHYNLIPR